MAESFIRKIEPDREGLDFEGLREDGIGLVQDLCGDVWTDYNLHDPGVTILEAFCYALTDLVYRSHFDTADYLAGEDGHIDFKRQVLCRPDEIFPSHAVTESDYRKLILNCDPDIDNVWIRPDDAGESQGLYRIYVLPNDDVKEQQAVVDNVRRLYLGNRNLCEDLAGIEIVERIPYSLCGEIEFGGKREPAKILAEIYLACTQYLCPAVPVRSYIGQYKQGKTLEELFDVALPGPGYIDDAELYPWRGDFSISDLIGRISRIEGVRNINQLQFVDASGKKSDMITLEASSAYRQLPCLRRYPRGAMASAGSDAEGIRFVRSGKRYQVQVQDVEEEYKRLAYKRQVARRQKQHFDWIGAMMPSGTFRNIGEYFSIQNHFPDIYGLNAYGVPASAPVERKAQAAQLKAYLLFFDQVMANFLENMQEAQQLFSLDESLAQSYFHQTLHNDTVADVETLYTDGIAGMDSDLGRLAATFDHYGDRRNRFLDYLLGIYGESLIQSSLRYLSDGDGSFEDASISNKIAFLQDIVEITGKRFVAFDYSKSSAAGRNVAALKDKLAYLLGLKGPDQEASPATKGRLREEDYYLVEHILLRPLAIPAAPKASALDDFYVFRLSFIFPGDAVECSNAEYRNLVKESIHLNCPAHIQPEIHWLDAECMERFIGLHERWLECKQASFGHSGELDEAAGALAEFLRGIRRDPRE